MRTLSFSILIFSLFFSTAWADEIPHPLNKVSMEFRAEQWVGTKTALVTIGLNATLADKAFEKMHAEILAKLKQLSAQADWHVTAFNRTADKSGLEQLQAQAVARLAENDIALLRQQVKTISKPGETYSVDDIQYSPSDIELRDAKAALRENIYQQINAEIARLNKDFPEQKYFLNEANFNWSQPVPMVSFTKVNNAAASSVLGISGISTVPQPGPGMSVSDKIELIANVVLASILTGAPAR